MNLLCILALTVMFQSDWKRVAYLEFYPGSLQLDKELQNITIGTTVQRDNESKEKVRTETTQTVDSNGKVIREVETTRSGTAKTTLSVPIKTSVLSIEEKYESEKDEGEKGKTYRVVIDDQPFFDLNKKEVIQGSNIAKDYIKAYKKAAKGLRIRPFVGISFGDKEKGIVIFHDSKHAEIKLRLWVKGRSFDVKTANGASGFLEDLAQL
jgi:hypothetical protein